MTTKVEQEFFDAKIYVGTYHKYNSGSLEGKWLELSDYSDIHEFYDACKKLHSDEEDPEFMFQDCEFIPEAYISESWLSEDFFETRDELDQKDIDPDNYLEFINHFGLEGNCTDDFESAFQGEWDSERDFSDYLFDELYEVPDSISNYIDYDSFCRDIFMGDYVYLNSAVFSTNW